MSARALRASVGFTVDDGVARLEVADNGIGFEQGGPEVPSSQGAAGGFGMCMEHVGASPVYTDLGQALTVVNADLSLTTGLAQSAPVFAPASPTYAPRVVNVALHYATTTSTGAAGYGFIGSGCAGSLGEVVVETPLERGSAYGRDPPPVVEDAERPSTLVGALSASK